MLSRSFNKITCKCTELHYQHCPATLIPFGDAIVGRLKQPFEKLLTSAAMVFDKDRVMEYSSSGSIFLVKSQEYLRRRIFLLGDLALTSLLESWREEVSCCSVQRTRWRPRQAYTHVHIVFFPNSFVNFKVIFFFFCSRLTLQWTFWSLLTSKWKMCSCCRYYCLGPDLCNNSSPVGSLDSAAIMPLNSILKLLSN